MAIIADTVDVRELPRAPDVDGRADDAEYGAPSIRLRTPQGEVRVWLGRRDGWLHVAAALPDSTFYWGDDFVVSIDPDGSGGATPGDGDRQWYLRRTLDSSVVHVAAGGRWYGPGAPPTSLGTTREHADWRVASTTNGAGWTVELRVRERVVRTGNSMPRLAVRTYDDRPHGWHAWPAPPEGTPPIRVERTPDLWATLRFR
jgi:hypothetical protein